MIGERIRALRDKTGVSQSELARKLGVTRSSVNAWESGLSAPTAVYLVELSKFFHVSTDYLLGVESACQLNLSDFQEEEVQLLYGLIRYFEGKKES